MEFNVCENLSSEITEHKMSMIIYLHIWKMESLAKRFNALLLGQRLKYLHNYYAIT